jgi:hypothetical protein
MPLTTRILTNSGSPLVKPDGKLLVNKSIVFTLVNAGGSPIDVWDATTGERVVQQVSSRTDTSGEFSVDLWPNDRGNVVSYYHCSVKTLSISDFMGQVPTGLSSYSWVEFFAGGVELTAQQIALIDQYLLEMEQAVIDTANSASAALASENNVISLYDSFDDRYLGAKASDPTVDNDGNPLSVGALYFNTVSNLMMAYAGTAWVSPYGDGVIPAHATNHTNGVDDIQSATNAQKGLATAAQIQLLESKLDGSPDYITFDTTPETTSTAVGTTSWNSDEDTLETIQSGAVLQHGQELQYPVRNATASIILNGKPVMKTGTLGASGRLTVDLMDGTDPANAKFFLGLATGDILPGADGKVSNFGKVRQYNTTAYLLDAILWISPTVIGGYVTERPAAGAMAMAVATVAYVDSNGTLLVRVNNVDHNSFAATSQSVGSLIATATEKTTPIDADMVGLMDSATGNILAKLSWLNIKATLKTYFDTLYASVLGEDDNYVTDAEKSGLTEGGETELHTHNNLIEWMGL